MPQLVPFDAIYIFIKRMGHYRYGICVQWRMHHMICQYIALHMHANLAMSGLLDLSLKPEAWLLCPFSMAYTKGQYYHGYLVVT